MKIDIPHALGREEARRRLASRIGELPAHIPGGVAQVESNWTSQDSMAIAVTAMGQKVSGTIDVADDRISVDVALPLMLSLMSGPIGDAISRKGGQLLLGPDKDGVK